VYIVCYKYLCVAYECVFVVYECVLLMSTLCVFVCGGFSLRERLSIAVNMYVTMYSLPVFTNTNTNW